MKTPLLLALLACALPAAAAHPAPASDEAPRELPAGPSATALRFRAGATSAGDSVEGRPVGVPPTSALTRLPSAAGQGWVDDIAAMDGLAPEVKLRYKIQRHVAVDNAVEYNVVAPPDLKLLDNARSYRGVTGMRGLGHYLVYEMGDAVAYQDLLVATVQMDATGRPRPDFATVMQVAKKGTADAELYAVAGPGGQSDLRWLDAVDTDVLRDGLKQYLSFSDAQVAQTVQNLATFTRGSGRYIVNKATRGNVLVTAQNGGRSLIFPQIRSGTEGPQQ